MKVRIKNVTGSTSNEWLLWELKKEARVKEGDIVEGKFILSIYKQLLLNAL